MQIPTQAKQTAESVASYATGAGGYTLAQFMDETTTVLQFIIVIASAAIVVARAVYDIDRTWNNVFVRRRESLAQKALEENDTE